MKVSLVYPPYLAVKNKKVAEKGLLHNWNFLFSP